jgi:hypothetical protein
LGADAGRRDSHPGSHASARRSSEFGLTGAVGNIQRTRWLDFVAAVYGLAACGADVACGPSIERDAKLSFNQFTVNAITSANATAPMTR